MQTGLVADGGEFLAKVALLKLQSILYIFLALLGFVFLR